MQSLLKNSLTHTILLTLSFLVALVLSSNISIPFYPVPFTLQTMMVMVAILYRRDIAFYSSLSYIGLGGLGFPLFADLSGGAHILVGPTGGYLLSFVIATGLIYKLNIRNNILNILLFNLILFICGVIQLSMFIGLEGAWGSGFVMFIIPELIKTIMAFIICKAIIKN